MDITLVHVGGGQMHPLETGSWQGKQQGATYSTLATLGWGDLTAPHLLVLSGNEEHVGNELI